MNRPIENSYELGILNFIDEGIIVYDADKNLQYINPSALNLLGMENSSAPGLNKPFQHADDFFAKIKSLSGISCQPQLKDSSLWHEMKEKPLKDIKVVFNHEGVHKQLKLSIFPVSDKPGKSSLVIVLKNCFALICQYDLLERQNHFIRGILDTLDVPIAVVSHPDMKYEIVNRNKCMSLAKLLGRPIEEKDIIGREVKDVAPFMQEKGICDMALITGYTKESIILDNVEYVDPDGESMYHKLILSPVVDENGNVSHVASVGIDLTEHIAIQNKIQDLSRAKEEFFSVISHELRTPINVILSAEKVAGSMITSSDSQSFERIKRWLTMIRQNGLRLLKLVNNILDLTKIDAGYMKAVRKNVNYAVLIKKIYESIAPFVEQKGIHITLSTKIRDLIIAVDEEKIERVIFNIISNALKYNKEGGSINITVYRSQAKVFTRVEDTGIGIPEDKLDIIFERFLQVNSSLSRPREGAGIGLSLCKAIASLHNGTIKVKSKLNEGSVFTLELPIVRVSDSTDTETEVSSSSAEIASIELSDIYDV